MEQRTDERTGAGAGVGFGADGEEAWVDEPACACSCCCWSFAMRFKRICRVGGLVVSETRMSRTRLESMRTFSASESGVGSLMASVWLWQSLPASA